MVCVYVVLQILKLWKNKILHYEEDADYLSFPRECKNLPTYLNTKEKWMETVLLNTLLQCCYIVTTFINYIFNFVLLYLQILVMIGWMRRLGGRKRSVLVVNL